MARKPSSPGIDACAAEIARAGKISAAAAKRVLQQVDDRADTLMRTKGLSSADSFTAAAKDLVDREVMASYVARVNRLKALRNDAMFRADAGDAAEATVKQFGPDGLPLALSSQIAAINTPTRGNRFSIEATARTRSDQLMGGLLKDLGFALTRVFRSSVMDRDIARELFQLTTRDAGDPATIGVTGNATAAKIAETVHKYTELARSQMNKAGSWIGNYAGWIARTTHDAAKMNKAGFETWRDHTLPRLDQDRTFEGVDNPERFMRDTYNALVSSIHRAEPEAKDAAFTGPGNLAKRLSQERVLHFKDADAWMDHMQEFGASGSLSSRLERSLMQAGNNIALMERLGTNPEAKLRQHISYFENVWRDRDPLAAGALRSATDSIVSKLHWLDGTNNRPANEAAAQFMQNTRNIMSMAHLGNVVFTHLFSMVTKASELRYQGVGFLDRWGNVFSSLYHGPEGRSPEMQQFADLMNAGYVGQHGHLFSRFTLDDSMPGRMATATSNFLNATGLNYVLGGQKLGTMYILARKLGMQMDRQFSDLETETQRGLRSYNISPDEWDALRSAPGHHDIGDGRALLFPDAAMRSTAPLTDFERDRLALKLHTYLHDVADRAIVTPGIAEKELLFRGKGAGTFQGELLRTIMQFKAWPVAATRQMLGREWYGNETMGAKVQGLISIAMAGIVLGYGRMATTDMLKGIEPRDPRDPRTMMAALLQSGGLGIFGDFLFGEFARQGQGLAEMLAGPTVGLVGQVVNDAWNAIKKEAGLDRATQGRDAVAHAFNTMLDNMPYVNLWYTRNLLNYLFIYRIQEALSPGFQRRAEKRLKERTGQTYWLSPAQTVR